MSLHYGGRSALRRVAASSSSPPAPAIDPNAILTETGGVETSDFLATESGDALT